VVTRCVEELKKIAYENERKILSSLISGSKKWFELLNETGLSKKGLAKHLKRLLEEGLIGEEIDKKDRRVKIYSITEKGKQYLEEIKKRESENSYKKVKLAIVSKLPQLSEEERKRVEKLLEELKELLEVEEQ